MLRACLKLFHKRTCTVNNIEDTIDVYEIKRDLEMLSPWVEKLINECGIVLALLENCMDFAFTPRFVSKQTTYV